MSKSFFLNSKDKKLFTSVNKIISDILGGILIRQGENVDITLEDEQIKHIAELLPCSAVEIINRWEKLTKTNSFFSLTYVETIDKSMPNKENIDIHVFREWHFFRSDNLFIDLGGFIAPVLIPIEKSSPAYALLEETYKNLDIAGNIEKIKQALYIPDHKYLPLDTLNSIHTILEICRYIVKNNVEQAALSANKPAPPVILKKFYNLPTSPASNLCMEVLSSGTNIADLPARKRKVTHGGKYEVRENGNSRQVIMTTPKTQITIELADIDKLMGSNKPAKKLFVFALIKGNERTIFGGELSKDGISFPLQELIDIGFYQTPQSARKGFKDGMDILTSLKIKGTSQDTKKKTRSIDALEVLFTGANIKNGQCTIYFNDRINWSFITRYFTILPLYYFKLSSRASDLLYYIFFIARQHTKEIEERGFFNISFRAIQSKLQLPSEIDNTRLQQTIKKPIEDAIEAIEEQHSATYNNMEMQLLPVYDETANIKDYLDNGYLQVTLTGAFAKTYIEISTTTKKQIKEAKKRQARIAEKAIAIKTAKSLEAKEQNEED